ncbi:hypothetical protein ACFQZV_06680 [Microbacterium koreense]|uniref:Uncharacterized protein n=1 Tax=Microbacterium koreense TaxID=323761 RepID=A0ABW2ZR76_9MICO
MRQRRLTWMIGGAGLVLCGVIGMLQFSVPGTSLAISVLVDVVFAAAVLLFAIGLSREGSVVARRPLGVTALAVVAVWPLVMRAAQPLLPRVDAATFDSGLAAYREVEGILNTVFFVDLAVSLAASLIACVQIARAGVVPKPWNWAPLWALLVVIVAAAVPQLLFAATSPAGAQGYADMAVLLGRIGFLVRTLGLGIIALVLAARVRPDAVDVYRSA